MTTGGEGGMATTDDPSLWSRMWSYKDHGKSWEAVYERQHPPGPRLVHDGFGTNWRMLEMQAAIGLIQLELLVEWTARRTAIARHLADACGRHGVVRVPHVANDVQHAYYRFYAFVEPQRLARAGRRDRIIAAINERDVPCYHGSALGDSISNAPSRVPAGVPDTGLPVAKELGETGMAFLVHPTITDDQVDKACAPSTRSSRLAAA